MPPNQTQLTPEQAKAFQDQINKISQGVQSLYKERGFTPPPVPTTISSDNIQPTKALALPQTTTTSTAGDEGFYKSFATSQQKLADDLAADEQKRNEARALSETEFGKSAKAILDLPAKQAQLEQEADIAGKMTAVTEARKKKRGYQNQLIAEQHALERQVEEIEKNAQGKLASGVASEVEDVRRNSLRKQADLSLLQLTADADLEGANLDLSTAQSIIDRKIDLQTKGLQQKFEFDKYVYENNRDLWSKSEERLLQQRIKQDERLYDFAKAEYGNIHDTFLEAVKNGAPEAVKQAILKAKTSQEAISAAGTWLAEVDTQIVDVGDRKVLIDSRTGRFIKELGPKATPAVVSDALNWLYRQPGFTQNDIEKFNSDPQFKAWVLRQRELEKGGNSSDDLSWLGE